MEIKLTMGEKLKDLRIERKLTTKQVSQLTGISEAVYNGLENDNDRDTGYSRIILTSCDLGSPRGSTKFSEVYTNFTRLMLEKKFLKRKIP